MEAKLNGGVHPFCKSRPPGVDKFGKRSMEWDLNDWTWDSNLLVATPENAAPSDCMNKQLFPVPALGSLPNCSPSYSEESGFGINIRGNCELEKRRREVLVVDEDKPEDEAASLTLKLGGRVYPFTDHAGISDMGEKNGKKSKVQVGAVCQVDGCGADLGDAKDYHRRHKVCEMHAKAGKAQVRNALQRFCQQCSRFHLLQEFDEGKRSCRRRLAGHNKRRRKTQPDSVSNVMSLIDDHSSSYLLTSLLRILTNLPSDCSWQVKDQELLSHLLKNLGSRACSPDINTLPGILQASQEQCRIETSAGPSEVAHALTSKAVTVQQSLASPGAKTNYANEFQCSISRPPDQPSCVPVVSAEIPCGRTTVKMSPGSALERVRFRSFDLNDVYDDGHYRMKDHENLGTHESQPGPPGSLHHPSWMQQNSLKASPSPPSGNSDSASAQSQSTFNGGDAKSRTDRMVFKLFGKDPSNFPLALRSQILDWLSNSPTDIEGYIRPGCVILTVYLRLPQTKWEEIYHNLRRSLERLIDVDGDDFWGSGWLFARINNQIAFIYDGSVVLDTSLFGEHNHCQILSVTPIAVSASERVNFTIKGVNLAQSSVRLLCAFDGKYLVQETTKSLVSNTSNSTVYDEDACFKFSCSIPNATGRGFIEVEDHGLRSSFFPFIVTENEVSSEIRSLESVFSNIYSNENNYDRECRMRARREALDFLNEIGWLLRRSHLSFSSEKCDSCMSICPPAQIAWLIKFAIDHNWCAVVKKLLDVLFSGAVNMDVSIELALSEMALLHNAVQKNQVSVVKLLLEYMPPDNVESSLPKMTPMKQTQKGLLFRPDVLGPFDVTPLHIAASRCNAQNVLDALTDDPGQVGIKAWKSARDSSGFTPEDYACSRGYKSYIHLVQEKINKKLGAEHVVDVRGISASLDVALEKNSGSVSGKIVDGFQILKRAPSPSTSCRICVARRPSGGIYSRNLAYRPAMLTLVGIAAVCVCVGILLHSPPEVFSVIPPFRWELLDYGYI